VASSLTTTTPDWFSPVGRYHPLRLCVFRQGLMTIPRVHWNPVRKSPSRRLALSRGVWPSIVALFVRCKQASGPHNRGSVLRAATERKRMGGVQYFAAALMTLLSPNFSSSSAAPSALSTSLASCPSPSPCRSHLAVTPRVLRADSAPKLRSQRNQAERVFKFLTS